MSDGGRDTIVEDAVDVHIIAPSASSPHLTREGGYDHSATFIMKEAAREAH